ncbi:MULTISPECIES: DUF883 family protein [Burkholderiaceae]|uniref:DUF883 domain-containing protein n=1 Tax=Caballeronia zhejiangensis TaxID=871203 RepID=A0A656QF68_9BURK|nr:MULTISPECIES: DUF883 family protein [Burkholderiaceae]KAK43921.1 hypothetical protein BG58_28580 [Caballeronia jiangsuensis]KDR28784.1 hypothetical protein BG60_09160 [Caballeronia zhejiangensis]KWU19238.1 hypothetical protein AS149_13430 [Burkholderia cenocepacia]SAL57886.1 membrane protein [Caballeronia peredens]
MADNDRAHNPVDALKTERADGTYEFPTSASMASGDQKKPLANNDDRSFREASHSWDTSSDGASSSDLRASAKNRLADLQGAMSRKYRVAADTTDDFVHENPWKAITMAALAGVVMGMLASR